MNKESKELIDEVYDKYGGGITLSIEETNDFTELRKNVYILEILEDIKDMDDLEFFKNKIKKIIKKRIKKD